jgi:N-acetylmuramoyl-L-alanine amidase
MRKVDTLIVHCTATRAAWWADRRPQEKVDEVRSWHVEERGWSDIGYHYLIDRDGTIVEGRPIEKAGAHAKGYNKTSVGIALFGGHGGHEDDAFDMHFTPEQDRALRKLIAQLRMEYPSINTVMGHNEVSAKMCPCFQVTSWLSNVQEKPKKQKTHIAQSKTVQASTIAKVTSAATPLVGVIGGLEWQKLALMGVFALVGMVALGVVDMERLKKWNKGQR